MNFPPKEIRRRARIALDGKYFLAVNMTISLVLFTFVMNLLLQSSGLSGSYKPAAQAMYWAIYLILMILNALLEAGLIRFLYSFTKTEPLREPGLLFYAFRNQPDSFILAYGFRYLISLIWFVPAVLISMRLPRAIDPAHIPAQLPNQIAAMLLLTLIACIPAVLLALPYCLTTYVLLDDPECMPSQALARSRQLMRGQYGRILRLWIGFLPLCLLGLGSFGTAFLWIRPYFHVSMAVVYTELQKPSLPQSDEPLLSEGNA